MTAANMPRINPSAPQTSGGGGNALRRWGLPLLILGGLLLAALVRIPCLSCSNLDMIDSELPWYRYVDHFGLRHALVDDYANYPPAFIDLLIMTVHLNAGKVPDLVAIKLMSIAFDIVAAVAMFRLVRVLRPDGPLAWIAMIALLLSPTVVVNGSVWGQSDIIYTSFLLLFLGFALGERPLAAIACFGFAFCFKLQSMWMSPFLLLLVLNGRMPWRYLLLLPVPFLLSCVPQILAGHDWRSVLFIYLDQASQGQALARQVANLYLLVSSVYYPVAMPLGLALTTLASLLLASTGYLARRRLSREQLLHAALLSVLMVPMLLPKMLNRYMFTADCVAVAFACRFPRYWFVPVLIQADSLTAYIGFLAGENVRMFTPGWLMDLIGNHRPESIITMYVCAAGVVNWLVLGFLAITYVRTVFPQQRHAPLPATTPTPGH